MSRTIFRKRCMTKWKKFYTLGSHQIKFVYIGFEIENPYSLSGANKMTTPF